MSRQAEIAEFKPAVDKQIKLCKRLKEGHEELLQLKGGISYELGNALPKLPVPCSKQEAVVAAREFMETYKRVMDELRNDAKNAKTRQKYVDLEIMRRQAAAAAILMAWNSDLLWDMDDERNQLEPYEKMTNNGAWNLGLIFKESRGKKDEELLQLYVQKMLQDQPDEFKLEVLSEYHHVTEPFNLVDSPTVTLTDKPATLNGSLQLPIEVATNIFAHCDLESAVELREVSSSWYAAYQKAGHVLKPLLNARSPWFYPDTMSWSDACLVFVSRLYSSKWAHVTCIDSVFEDISHPAPPKLVAFELEHGEKMPQYFQPLDDDWKTYRFDPEVRYTDTETIVSFDGKTIILPPDTRIKTDTITPLKHHLQVDTLAYGGLFAFPYDKPMHWKHAHRYGYGYGADQELGRYFYKKDSQDLAMVLKDPREQYLFKDIYADTFLQYGAPCAAEPTAVHNGLVWWTSEDESVPTFVDLENPDCVYYRRDRIIGMNNSSTGELKQCQNTRYVMRLDKKREGGSFVKHDETKWGHVIYDLESGKSVLIKEPYKSLTCDTKFVNPYREFLPAILPGHVNGKFCAIIRK